MQPLFFFRRTTPVQRLANDRLPVSRNTMAREDKQKVFYYWHATFLQGAGILQRMLTRVRRQLPQVFDRLETIVEGGSELQVLIHAREYRGMFTANQVFFETVPAERWLERARIREAEYRSGGAPGVEEWGTYRVLESVAFFAVCSHHIVLPQSRALRSRQVKSI